MKSCPTCATANNEETRFCTNCGAKLGASQPPYMQGSPIAAVGVAVAAGIAMAPTPTPGAVSGSARISSTPAPGMLIDGKYEVERVLGEGAMGIVYLARDVVTETKVVIKSIRAEFADHAEFRARAIEEGRVLAHIDHPNVVRLNAVVVEAGQLYLVMQYIEGNSLDRLIEGYVAQGRMIPLEEALRIFRMMVQGVAAAHHEGVIHRDIKPANILVRAKDGIIKVSDFGIAKTGDALRTGRQRTIGVVGSPAYMAPEQRSGALDLDRRADIYSLGIVFFELLVGKLPFVAATEMDLFRLHSEAELPSVCRLRPDLPPSLDAVLARACAKDRRNRFSTCEELEAALGGAGLPITRSVPPTIMATQGLPSTPPAPPDFPRGSSAPPRGSSAPPHGSPPQGSSAPPHGSPPRGSYRSPAARTLSDPSFLADPSLPNSPAPARSVGKYVAIGGGLLLLLAGVGLGVAFAAGAFDDARPALVEPPKPRNTTPAPSPSPAPPRVDGGKAGH